MRKGYLIKLIYILIKTLSVGVLGFPKMGRHQEEQWETGQEDRVPDWLSAGLS